MIHRCDGDWSLINTGREPMAEPSEVGSTSTAEMADHPVGCGRLSPHSEYFSKSFEILLHVYPSLDFSNITELLKLLAPST